MAVQPEAFTAFLRRDRVPPGASRHGRPPNAGKVQVAAGYRLVPVAHHSDELTAQANHHPLARASATVWNLSEHLHAKLSAKFRPTPQASDRGLSSSQSGAHQSWSQTLAEQNLDPDAPSQRPRLEPRSTLAPHIHLRGSGRDVHTRGVMSGPAFVNVRSRNASRY